jgi:hypothetical protein
MANETDSPGPPERSDPAWSRKDTAAAEQADEGSGSEQGAADQQPRSEAPIPDVEDLERLRTRLIAKHHGRRR